MSDILAKAVDRFMDSVDARLKTMRSEMLAAVKTEVASAVQSPDLAGPVGPVGPQGEKGMTGRGIEDAELKNGNLVFLLTDGTIKDLGRIAGEKGEPGEVGPRGPQGEVGPQGPAGEMGPQGERGEKGEVGDKGERGEKGQPGEKGEAGAQGERGEKGEPGAMGQKGERGEKGDVGPIGERGEKGAVGDEGARGPRGEKGLDGRDGKDGRDGIGHAELREAVEATVRTHIADVLKLFSFDGRTLSFGEQTHRIPSIVYRGIWSEGESYELGDMVTFGGSLFHCEVERTEQRPESGSDWRLAVKRGRDGKGAR